MHPKSLAGRIETLERQVEQLRLEMTRLRATPEPKPAKKAKATLEEVAEFCRSLELPATDAEWFFNKCEGNGWKNNGKAILDWKATIRSWKLNHYLPSQKQSNGTTTHRPGHSGELNPASRYQRK